jgi:putative DNA primase/helicase
MGFNDKTRNCAVTTAPFGAGQGTAKWRDSYSETLRGKNVYIIGDNNEAGEDYAIYVHQKLQGIARSVYIADIAAVYPELPAKGDVTDLYKLEKGNSDKIIEILCNSFRAMY